MGIQLTDSLRKEYVELFNNCQPDPTKLNTITNICNQILTNKEIYQKIGFVPWYIVGVIHQMEASGNFKTHLHNGDPLYARTVHVPAGRPKLGSPPFLWDVSARDALCDHPQPNSWDVADALYFLEGYNGFGYRQYHPQVKSPYLWSFSNIYTCGKYTYDGKFSSTAVSGQCGAAVMLKYMANKGWFTFGVDDYLEPPVPAQPVPPLTEAKKETANEGVKPTLADLIMRWFGSMKKP